MKRIIISFLFLGTIFVSQTFSTFSIELGTFYHESHKKYLNNISYEQPIYVNRLFHSINNSQIGICYDFKLIKRIKLKCGISYYSTSYKIKAKNIYYYNSYTIISYFLKSYKFPFILKIPIINDNHFFNFGITFVEETLICKKSLDISSYNYNKKEKPYRYIEINCGFSFKIFLFDYVLYPEIMYDYLLTPIYFKSVSREDKLSYSYIRSLRFSVGIDLKSFTSKTNGNL